MIHVEEEKEKTPNNNKRTKHLKTKHTHTHTHIKEGERILLGIQNYLEDICSTKLKREKEEGL